MSAVAPLVVAIDGPAGVGKSTAARGLARRLGVPYLDTGAMYRALALEVLEEGVDPADREAVEELAARVDIDMAPRTGGEEDDDAGALDILLHGRPVGERIRTPEVSEATSVIAAYPGVRRRLVALQRQGGERWGGVVEGRDIGTRVFPDTPFKFFLDAHPEVRHQRRYEELARRGRAVTLEGVAVEMRRRDRRDSGRADSPLTHDDRYLLIDTSELSMAEVVERMLAAIRGLQKEDTAAARGG